MRVRTLAVPLALLVALSGTSSAKTAPLIEDPAGDHPVAAGDILTADILTTKKGKGALEITMTVGAPPSTTTPYAYTVMFTADDCDFSATYFGHPLEPAFLDSGVGCTEAAGGSKPAGNVKVSGSTITFLVPLTGALKKGVVVTDISAVTMFSGMLNSGPIGDSAATDKTYKIGS